LINAHSYRWSEGFLSSGQVACGSCNCHRTYALGVFPLARRQMSMPEFLVPTYYQLLVERQQEDDQLAGFYLTGHPSVRVNTDMCFDTEPGFVFVWSLIMMFRMDRWHIVGFCYIQKWISMLPRNRVTFHPGRGLFGESPIPLGYLSINSRI
jgi:hypothetical protein